MATRDRSPSSPAIGGRRRFAFTAVAVLLALVVLELSTRVFEGLGQAATHETSAYVDFVNPVPVFERATLDGRSIYRRTPYQPLVVRGQSFAGDKAPGTVRAFLLGGSAASGWPHQEEHNGYTITSLLARKLELVLPGRPIEVLNLGGSTYGSHRVKFVFDEIVAYEPDLVLIYSGNNEFLENFVFSPALPPWPWSRSALARRLHDAAGRWSSAAKPKIDVQNYSLADQAVNRISYAFGRASRYRQDPEQYAQVLAHYLFNIRAMVRECKRRGVTVMVLNCPVNLKDWIPNVSVHRRDLGAADLARWQERFRAGILALEAGEWAKASEALTAAVVIDDEYAEGHYHLGIALQRLGRVPEAKAALVRALERDAYPFRNLPEFRAALAALASEENVPYIDSVAILDAMAEDGIAGLDVLVDYVHLRGRSQEAIAQAVLETMGAQGMLGAKPAIALEQARIEVPALYDDMATDRGLVSMYRQLLVMRQYDKLDAVFERMTGVLRGTILSSQGEAADNARRQLQIAERIQEVVGPYRRLLRAEKLGILREEFSEDEAREVFRNYMDMVRFTEGQALSEEEFARAVPELDYPAPSPASGN